MVNAASGASDSVQMFSAYISALRTQGKEMYITKDEGKKRKDLIQEMVDILSSEETTKAEKTEALEKLWLHVCFYVMRELKKSRLPWYLFEDALQESFVTLATKAHKYDPNFNPKHKTSFVGFLSRCRVISNATQDAIVKNQVVRDAKSVKTKLLDEIGEIEGVHTTVTTTTEYEDYMGVDSNQQSTNLSNSSAERGMYNKELRELFSDIFSNNKVISQTERTAILGKYGLMGHQQFTLKELQDIFFSQGKKISMARISQIQKAAAEKIRDYLISMGVDAKLMI